MAFQVQQTIPLMRIFDVDRAKEFYCGFLGFQADWEHRFDNRSPVYIQVSRDELTLHLTGHHGDCCPGSTVFVWMQGLREFHQEITARDYGAMRPGLEQAFYGALCMEVIDPFGNRIRFNERLDESPAA